MRMAPLGIGCLHRRHFALPVGARPMEYTLGRALKPIFEFDQCMTLVCANVWYISYTFAEMPS